VEISALRARPTRVAPLVSGGLFAIVALALVVVVVFELLPDLFAPGPHPGFGPKDTEEAREAVRTSGLQFVGGLVLVVGAVLTALNLRQTRLRDEEQRRANEERALIDREGQITERFTRAIDQLGSAALDVRLGGIYALERLARESRDDHGPIMEVLTAFVRERSPWPPLDEEEGPHRPSADVQAAFTVLGRRNRDHEPDWEWYSIPTQQGHQAREYHLNLRSVDFRGASLPRADFSYDDLIGSHFEGANLDRARFWHAELGRSDFRGANLRDASLSGAIMSEAHFEHATLWGADLSEVWMTNAFLEGANLDDANVETAVFDGTRIDDATKLPDGLDERAQSARFIYRRTEAPAEG
jgi:hypothetical protein